MELFDQFDVPIFLAAMVTIELELICFIIIVLLEFNSGIVAIFSLFMWYFLIDDRRSILFLWDLIDVLLDLRGMLQIPVLSEVVLIVDSYAESLWVFGLRDKWIECA